jgi:putative hydrolase of the HAD superfamily
MQFKKMRVELFYEKFNPSNIDLNTIEVIFRNVDLMSNAITERSGQALSAEVMYGMVCYQVERVAYCSGYFDLDYIYSETEKLFFENVPVLLNESVTQLLHEISNKSGCTISILSNTGFIKGSSLRMLMNKLGLESLFLFQMYSDEEGLSKPNPELFQRMYRRAIELRSSESLNKKEVVHVGDNLFADCAGASNFGINSFLVHEGGNNILDVLDL